MVLASVRGRRQQRVTNWFICLHGAAQGAWKFSATRTFSVAPSMSVLNCSTLWISWTCDMEGGGGGAIDGAVEVMSEAGGVGCCFNFGGANF
jgi:hypothetical protein